MLLLAPAAVRVRTGFPDDHAAVSRVLARANLQFARELPPAFYQAYIAGLLDIRSRLPVSDLLVAEVGGHVVGTATVYPDASLEGWGLPREWAGIRAVAVEPAARGQGIGRRLVDACLERAFAHGKPAACLHTATFMAAAVRLYEGAGFERVPAFDRGLAAMFPADDVGAMTAIAYRCWVDPSRGATRQ